MHVAAVQCKPPLSKEGVGGGRISAHPLCIIFNFCLVLLRVFMLKYSPLPCNHLTLGRIQWDQTTIGLKVLGRVKGTL